MSNFQLSKKIIIGGAQLGTSYGISNIKKQTIANSKKLIDLCIKKDIKIIDTAIEYKTNYKIINYISKKKKFKIITKLPHRQKKQNLKKYIKELENIILNYLSQYNIKKFEVLLVHRAEDLLRLNGDLIYKKINDFKNKNLTKKIGISVYDANSCIDILNKFDFDVVQLPINIFNNSFLTSKILDKIKKKNIEIHARSLFFQGLIFIDPNNLNSYFNKVKEKFFEFDKDCNHSKIEKIKQCIYFIEQIPQIDKYIIGFNNNIQLQEFLNINFQKNNLLNFKKYIINESKFINPSKWKI